MDYRVVVFRLGTVLMTSLLISACGGSSNGITVVPADESSTVARDLAPKVAPATEKTAVNGINALGKHLLDQAYGSIDPSFASPNVVVAPLSASLTLAQLRAGALGKTRTAISDALLLSGSDADIDPAYNKIALDIGARISEVSLNGQTSQSSAGGWVQARYGYLLTYLDSLAFNYGIKPLRTDFAANPDAADSIIYDWTSQSSGGVAYPVDTTRDTRLVLGDALRLNAAWLEPFDPAQTQRGSFQRLGGSTVEAQFLRKTSLLRQTAGDGYAAVELQLMGGDLRLLVILPDEGRFAEIQGALNGEWLNQVLSGMNLATVDLSLPLFTVAATASVPLGAFPATRDVADFSAIDGTRDLFVSGSIHQSRLSITAKGLQAGAATTIALDDAHPETWTNPNGSGYGAGSIFTVGSGGIIYNPEIPVTLGRPFIFAVRDAVSGAFLFLGQVLDPTR